MDYLKNLVSDLDNVKVETHTFVTLPPGSGTCCIPRGSWETGLYVEIHKPKNLDDLRLLLSEAEANDSLNVTIEKEYYGNVWIAWYKKPGFDDAFNAMKVLKPKLTEFDFAFTCGFDVDGLDNPDYDLVNEEIYHGEKDCIYDEDGLVYKFERPDEMKSKIKEVSITVKDKNLEANLDILSKIILTQKQ